MNEDEVWAQERQEMVLYQIQRRGVTDERVLAAMRRIPRHRFVPAQSLRLAYSDGPLPIGGGQTISQPYMVAVMSEYLHLKGAETVLEIGTGSGYQAAVLAELCQSVVSIEYRADLSARAGQLLTELGYLNIHLYSGDGSLGWPACAPYQGILVTAAAPSLPQPLVDQLAEGGRMVIPVGSRGGQSLMVCEKTGGTLSTQNVMEVSFVPLLGRLGWQEPDWQKSFLG